MARTLARQCVFTASQAECRGFESHHPLCYYYPVTQGLPEIVAYLAIATQSDRHTVDSSTIDSITISGLELETQLQLTLPHIIFHR
jgi:hypothetical protein